MVSTLIDVLLDKAEAQPDSVAYVFLADGANENARLTCAQLDLRARAIAAVLMKRGGKGERALLLFPPGLGFLEAFFGCAYGGNIAVPLPAPDVARLKRTLPRLLAVAADTEAAFVLTTRSILAVRNEICSQIPALASTEWLAVEDIPDTEAKDWSRPVIGGDDLAYLQYSSGSTSTPKGIMISHANVLHNVSWLLDWGKYIPGAASVTWLPHFHDYGLVHGLLASFCNGGTCYVISPLAFLKRPVRWLQAISRYKAMHSQAPTFGYDYCVRKIRIDQCAGLDLSSWRGAAIGAEPIHLETMQQFEAMFQPFGFRTDAFCPGYGLAEATLVVSTDSPGCIPIHLTLDPQALEQNRVVEAPEGFPGGRALSASGRLHHEAPIRIVDPETCEECPPDRVGEIWCGGNSVGLGYWNKPEETEKTFRARIANGGDRTYLRTGDLGFIAREQLFVTGRLKDLIVIAGANHYPQDLEWTAEASHTDLRPLSSAAFSVTVDNQERLVVVAEAKTREEEFGRIHDSIRRAIAESHELEVYAVAILRPGSICKTSSGKIQRSACRTGFLSGTLDILSSDIRSSTISASSQAAPSRDGIRDWLRQRFAAVAGIDPDLVDVTQPLAQYGMTSIEAVSAVADLEDWLHQDLSPTLLYQYPTIEALSARLSGASQEAGSPTAILPGIPPAVQEPIAIIGIGCRFPGANNPESFWKLICDGVDAVSEVPPDRWDIDAFYAPEPATPGKMNTRWGAFVKDVGHFDPQFFGISPREAIHMDPQQRILMEVAWEALEDAGVVPERLAGTQTGVFIGICASDYGWLQLCDSSSLDTYSETGSALSIAANRLSYAFDFRGPSVAVDTACSSSLTAVHQACESLRRGQSTVALAGGVNLILIPEWTIAASQARMMSEDGRCMTFDSRANGYVRGEGCGLVVLKRLSDAVRDRDPIVAVIRGTAVNQDGRSNGLTAPNPAQQQQVIQLALRDAGVSPHDIHYVEAHGTGTSLGDPIEFQALSSTLGQGRDSGHPCLIGSVKTNIGHLEAAAGIAGLIKVALSLAHEQIPPHRGLKEINPYIKIAGSGLQIATTLVPWARNHKPRLAGVSSFGVGGTNTHAILEEAPSISFSPSIPIRPLHVLTISAKTPASLQDLLTQYEKFLRDHDRFPEIAYTSNTGRSHFAHRIAIVAGTSEEARQKLAAFLSGETPASFYEGVVQTIGVGTDPALVGNESRDDWQQLLERAAELYVHGAAVDWAALGKDFESRKVSLPTYAFQRRRYWIGAAQKTQDTLQPPRVEGQEHPLLGRRLRSPAIKDIVFQAEVSALYPPILRDHTVYDRLILPASAYLEMALAAIKTGLPAQSTLSIRDCDIVEALVLPSNGNPTTLQTILAHDDPTADSFQIVSLKDDGDSWQVHASGKIRKQPAVISKEAIRVEDIQARCRERLSSTDLYSFLKQLSLSYGPGFQGVTEVWRRKGEALGRIRRPSPLNEASNDATKEANAYFLHPVLLDSCFHVIVAAYEYEGGDEAFVPVRIGTLDVFDRVPEEFWVRAVVRASGPRNSGVVTADLYLFDDEGKPFAELTNLTCRRVGREKLLGAAAKDDYRDWLYRLEWQTKESDYIDGQMDDGQWLILADRGGIGESIRAILESQGQRCVCAHTDDEAILQSTPEQPLRGVIHLWALDATDDQLRICGSAHQIVKAASAARLSPAPRFCLVTRGTQSVDSLAPANSPSGATLWGLANVLAAEHPDLRTVVIDLDPQPEADEARFILEEALTNDRETRIAMRKRLRHVQRLARIRPPNAAPPRPAFNAEFTYLVSGGLGAIGLKIAKWMVDRGARHVVLAGRRKAAESARGAPGVLGTIEALRKDGAEIVVSQVDVGDPSQVEDLLEHIRKNMPPLRGVAHAAGVLNDGLIAQQDWDAFAAVMRPKVQGAWNLHVQTLDAPLDFFLLFSSAAAFMPNAGQASYSAANAFLDSLAGVRKGQGLAALSVNWGRWQGPGLADGTGKQDQNRLAAHGVGRIDSDQGLRALDVMFNGEDAQIAVLPLDWRKYFSHYREGAEPMLLSKLAVEIRGHVEDEQVQKDRIQLLERLEKATASERQEIVEDFIAQQVMEVLGFKSREEVDLSVGFFEIGLDSMMAVELQSRIQTGLGVSIPATTAFDQPNITALARFLLETLLVFETPAQPENSGTQDELSEDQILAFLADEYPEQISTVPRENS